MALVTGGGSGIGRATTLRLAEEGARIVAVDRNTQGGQETVAPVQERHGEALFVQADVSQEADTRRMVDAAVQTYGRLDILFDNAASQVFGTLPETPQSDWDKVMDVNLKGVYLGCKHAIPT